MNDFLAMNSNKKAALYASSPIVASYPTLSVSVGLIVYYNKRILLYHAPSF